jgi:putative oxidoreductase|tara:strand:+ start:80 stop:568 length:489 start_codon:yes stop_codon:yes gene_type:complete
LVGLSGSFASQKQKNMKELLFQSQSGWAGLVLRITAALVMFPHGAQKLMGWFGGYGFKGTMGYFTQTVGLPWVIGFLVIVLEVFGSLAILAGIGTRLWAIALGIVVIGIMFTAHIQNGFFMNWFGNQAGEGVEYFLLLLGIYISLVISGSGKLSVDELLMAK